MLSATVRTCAGDISPVPVITITNYTIIPISPFSPTQTGGGINITVTSTLGSSTSGELYYKWVNQQTQQIVSATKDLVNVGPGTYCVTISGRCATQSACYIIPACAYAVPGGLFHLAFAPAPKPCPKQPNGGIDLTVSGLPAPYAYSWSNSVTTQDITNVKAGTYVVKVTDANGCFYSEAYTLHDAIEEVSTVSGSAGISVSDVAGRIIFRSTTEVKEGENLAQVDLGKNIKAGAYFLILEKPDKSRSTGKLIRSEY